MVNKEGGLLDQIKETLAPLIWDSNLKLKSSIKSYILTHIRSLISEEILSVVILGSITGYKYTDTSDVDVNVIIPVNTLTDELWERRRNTNGINIPGTKHSLNIFLQEELPGKENSWKDAKFGVYDVLQDRWIVNPISRDVIRDPFNQFQMELFVGRAKLRYFNSLVAEWRNDKTRLALLQRIKEQTDNVKNEIARKKKEIKRDEENLWVFSQDLENGRRFEYERGWGTPRENYRNIVYKLIEHSLNGEVFSYFAKLKKSSSKNV